VETCRLRSLVILIWPCRVSANMIVSLPVQVSIVFSKRTLCLKIYCYAHEFLMYGKKLGRTRCVRRCLLHVYHWRPKGCTPCVSYGEDQTPSTPPNRTGCEPATQQWIPQKHTQINKKAQCNVSFRHFRRPPTKVHSLS
jgi:hypothetical protein